jgi:hypothetical protein
LASAQVRAVAQAGAVLEELLTDVWAGEDIISAFDRLQPAAMPTYAQLREQSTRQEQQQQPPWLQQHQADEQLQDSAQRQPAAQSGLAAGPQGATVGASMDPQQFHAFAEYVLDNALLGTLQEGGVAGAAEDDQA